jgi:hypothetical protein
MAVACRVNPSVPGSRRGLNLPIAPHGRAHPGGSDVLVNQGEQVASPLDDLADVATSDPLHLLAVQVRGALLH